MWTSQRAARPLEAGQRRVDRPGPSRSQLSTRSALSCLPEWSNACICRHLARLQVTRRGGTTRLATGVGIHPVRLTAAVLCCDAPATPAPADIALYYPYVHPRDDGWLKHAVLFWPRIARIIPPGYLRSDTESARKLQEAGILLDRNPGPAAFSVSADFGGFVAAHAGELTARHSLTAARRLEPPRDVRADGHVNPHYGWIHRGKITNDAIAALTENQLATEHGDWIGMHPALSNVYMCALTAKLAARGLNVPITDQGLHHVAAAGWELDDLARALLPDTDLVADASDGAPAAKQLVVSLALRSLALPGIDAVPIERIIELRHEHGDQFVRFRAAIASLAASVVDLDDIEDPDALAQHVELRYQDTIETDRRALIKDLKRKRFDIADSAVSLQAVPPTGLAAAAIANIVSTGAATGAMTAVAGINLVRSQRASADEINARHPTAWLISVEKGMTPAGLAGTLQRIANKFGRREPKLRTRTG